MIVDKILDIASFKPSKRLENHITFNIQKRNLAKNDSEKEFYKNSNNALYGKNMGNVPNRIKVEFIKKDDTEKIMKRQSKIIFNGIHKSFSNYDSYTFKQNEVLMDKSIYLGFSIIELSKLMMHETY